MINAIRCKLLALLLPKLKPGESHLMIRMSDLESGSVTSMEFFPKAVTLEMSQPSIRPSDFDSPYPWQVDYCDAKRTLKLEAELGYR